VRRAATAAAVLGCVLTAGCGAKPAQEPGRGPGHATTGAGEPGHATARFVAERDALVPGDTLALGVSFAIERDWHLYGNAANDTGYPIHVTPELPPGYRALGLLWPAPRRHVSPGNILDHVYEDRVTLLLPVVVPAHARVGERVSLAARLQWLVCRDVCLPESARVTLELPVRARATLSAATAALFAETRARLPAPLPPEARASRTGKMVAFEFPGARSLAFYPGTECPRFENPIRDGAAEGERLSLALAGTETGGAPVEGVLEVTRPDGTSSCFSVRLGPPAGP